MVVGVAASAIVTLLDALLGLVNPHSAHEQYSQRSGEMR
jgi:hypothetical protein